MTTQSNPDQAETAANAEQASSGWSPMDCLRSLGRAASIAAGTDPNEADGAVWTLAENSKDLFMVCRYSDTNARLIKQLEAHEKFCAVKDIRGPEDSTAGGGISLACK